MTSPTSPGGGAADASDMPPAPWKSAYPPGISPWSPVATFVLSGLIDEAAAKWPDRTAIEFGGRRTSYGALARAAAAAASRFVAMGVRAGDRVALLMANTVWYPVVLFGALKAGATVVPLSPLDAPPILEFKLADCAPSVLVASGAGDLAARAAATAFARGGGRILLCEEEGEGGRDGLPPPAAGIPRWTDPHAPAAPARLPHVRENELALLQYTGGTTGMPRAVMLTHRNVSAALSAYDLWYRAWNFIGDRPDKVLLCLPLFHIFGLNTVLLRALRSGSEVLLRTRFDPVAALCDIEGGATTVPGVPTMWFAMMAVEDFERRNLSSLRLATSGGAPMPVEAARRFRELTGVELIGGWGMTELAPVGTNIPPGRRDKEGTIGVPLPGIFLRVVSLEDPRRALAPGETGELAVSGANVTAGYYNRPEENATAFVDGWLLTGDIGRMDADGFFYIVDRKKDMIITSGFNVYPQMIERAIGQHGDVEEVLVIGIPDPVRGEAVKAFVTLSDGAPPLDLGQLRAFLKDRLGPHELPVALEIRGSLPRTPVGKLSRLELKRQEHAAYPRAG